MEIRDQGLRAMLFSWAIIFAAPAVAREAAGLSAIERMQAPGAEAELLATRVGAWDVTMTLWPTADASPIVTTGLVAERRMVGWFLEEMMRPAPGAAVPDFHRIAYLHFNRVEGRWQYVSLDTRFPSGVMPAIGERGADGATIELAFEPLAFAGWGDSVDGWMLRSDLQISLAADDEEVVRQHWVRADGTAKRWLAVEYRYRRRR